MRALPASGYIVLILHGYIYPVMGGHSSSNTGLILCACADLSHTGHAYYAVE